MMAKAPSGDTRFRRIFDAHLEAVQRYCARRLSPADANDAVSEVFLVVWRRLTDVPSGEETLPWLLGVARNAVRNVQRSGRRSERLAAKTRRAPEPEALSPEVQVVRHAEYDEVAAALRQLSDDDREVIRLRAWEEMSATQIAIALGVSTAAAEKRVSRANERLKKRVERQRSRIRPRVIEKGGDA